MSLEIKWIGGFNPFDFIKCPVCDGTNFLSLSATGVYCAGCNTRFQVRCTAGDPGCVVDAFTDQTEGPKHSCKDCGITLPVFGEDIPRCPSCGGEMEKDSGLTTFPEGSQKTWYHILKRGDRSSGWLNAKTYEKHPDGTRQEEWEAFQKALEG
jgi:hypothetical protein